MAPINSAGLLGLPKGGFASLDGSLQSLPAPLSWEQLEARLQDAPSCNGRDMNCSDARPTLRCNAACAYRISLSAPA